MNIINNSISILTSLCPQSQKEALIAVSAVSVGYSLAAASGALVAGITVAAGIALKRGIQSLARLYLKSLPTPEETRMLDRKLEGLKFHILCQTMTIDSFTIHKGEGLIQICDAIGQENLTLRQRSVLAFLRSYLDTFPTRYQRFQAMDPQERPEWLKDARTEAMRIVRIPLNASIP
jgi:hypothetical protein